VLPAIPLSVLLDETLKETEAAYGYRKQRNVGGYRTQTSSTPRPMPESHTDERRSNSLNLFRTSSLAGPHNRIAAATIYIGLKFSVIA
jgi:hypothetical protein